ncbi:MAG: hypothetical protein CM1200mP41_33000 [Gammaproteobacteria bacterium]|nr:MAG: hypothetical protein CM1200mP41_33000 [Gammaproteobacteria bacterium]
MVDTWATVGSCAQIGKDVHFQGVSAWWRSGPLQASPTIIEDNCFIGARSEIVEGVIVGHGSVISMGVYIGQSTRILDRRLAKLLWLDSTRLSGGLWVNTGSGFLIAFTVR